MIFDDTERILPFLRYYHRIPKRTAIRNLNQLLFRQRLHLRPPEYEGNLVRKCNTVFEQVATERAVQDIPFLWQHSISLRENEKLELNYFNSSHREKPVPFVIAFIHLALGREIICGIHLKVLMHIVRPDEK
jgi:hypothetical protein